MAHTACFVDDNYSHAELACGELGAFKRKLRNLGVMFQYVFSRCFLNVVKNGDIFYLRLT